MESAGGMVLAAVVIAGGVWLIIYGLTKSDPISNQMESEEDVEG